jgi:hypothetical protein
MSIRPDQGRLAFQDLKRAALGNELELLLDVAQQGRVRCNLTAIEDTLRFRFSLYA